MGFRNNQVALGQLSTQSSMNKRYPSLPIFLSACKGGLNLVRYELDQVRIPPVSGCLSFNLYPLIWTLSAYRRVGVGEIFKMYFMRVKSALKGCKQPG